MNKALLFFLAFFLSIFLNAQNANFNSYNFGEGLEFVSEDEHSFKLGGYIQPFLECGNCCRTDPNGFFIIL